MSKLLRVVAQRTLIGSVVATGAWTLGVWHDSSKVPHKTITTSHTVPEVFAKSPAHRIVNPRQTPHAGGSLSMGLKIMNGSQISKQQILVWFMDGLFQNWIFAPEEVLMKGASTLAGAEFTHVSCKCGRKP